MSVRTPEGFDQTSSWESELEGENAEELASPETLDEEGEWCWPKKGRVTRWGRRIDSRLAVHFLAEEDEDEQVSRGLHHFASRISAGTQWTWKKVDSGAAENVMPRFPEIGSGKQRGPRMEKDSRDQELREADHVRQDP